MKKLFLVFFLSMLFLGGCTTKNTKDNELGNLVSLFVGEFSNKDQSSADASFKTSYITNRRIWKDRPGYWIYSEVFEPEPNYWAYSQRIINYKRIDSLNFISTSYALPNPKIFDSLTHNDLHIRNGCDVYYKKKTRTIYVGKTIKGECSSTIKTINYLTSSFIASKDKISIWTRGFNQRDKQVWGLTKGPYVYKKISK